MGSKAALIFLGIMIIGCNHVESKNFEFMDPKVLFPNAVTATNGQICQNCLEFTTKAILFLGKNETQTEIIGNLHQACSHLLSFEPQCNLLMDYYAPLFFVEIAKWQPKLLCEKVNLCKEMSVIHLRKPDDPCTLCHNAINEVLTKLEDPETQLEVIQILIKACNKAENFAHQCKKLVLEYGPIIMANTQKFLEKTDICTAIHVCKAQKATEVEQQFLSASA
ncbi:proactivator polypeptide-like 1 isoform X2 [Dendrobium catenatum]|uniref:proactivator polypeptide-like 1 isoform X2 n=1 Tax=Dendrobium catenatum TaxID=906689 RepID=UPI00109EEB73|nr:proactivator polypeptide-like 1 isoform X2 [Dendrobium catenatum]